MITIIMAVLTMINEDNDNDNTIMIHECNNDTNYNNIMKIYTNNDNK